MTKITLNIIAVLLMKKNKHLIFGTMICLIAIACQTKEITPTNYLSNWTKHKEEVADKQIGGGMDMKLTYNPAELLIMNELEGVYSKSKYEKSKEGFEDHLYFTLDISNTPLSKKSAEDLKKHFIRDRQRQFSLCAGSDTIPCILYHPEMISDGEKQIRLNLVFPKPQNMVGDSLFKQDLHIQFRENYDTTNQVIHFAIKGEKINTLPKIKF